MRWGLAIRRAAAVALLSALFVSGFWSEVSQRLVRATGPASQGHAVAAEVQRWSDRTTWGGRVPGVGAQVHIPKGMTVLLDVSPPWLGSLQIDGALVFDNRDLELRTESIMVYGRLQVGSADRPFRHRAVITLTGSAGARAPGHTGSKVLAVMGGVLDLHGEPRGLSWTRLARTARAGATQLLLERPVDWGPGDRIVIASTDFDPMQAEEATVKTVKGNAVTLDRPLDYMHWGDMQTFDGVRVDERAEVGLLTRNVVVQGDGASTKTGIGGHVMIMSGSVARITWAEFHRMGQKKVLGRYPVHFHMAGGMSGSYVKHSSIHHSFNRCLTIHGTHKVVAQSNVAYDTIGHCYFLEDGVETQNVLEGNLGLVTRAAEEGQALLPSDMTPATFWITHPDNIFRGNVAAGSEGQGFWFALPKHPTGLSKSERNDRAVWPRRTPLGEFSGNVAHSNADTGLFIDGQDGGDEAVVFLPRRNPIPPASEDQPDSPPVPAEFADFTAYKNRQRGIWLSGEHLRVKGATLADNAIGATFLSVDTFIRDSLIVGETANKGALSQGEAAGLDGRTLPNPADPAFPIRGFEFFWEHVGPQRVTFVNFMPNKQRQAAGLGFILDSPYGINVRNFAESARFVNANAVYLVTPNPKADGDKSAVFVDKDGSVTGAAGRLVVANNPFMIAPDCALRRPWNAYVCHNVAYGRLSITTSFEKPTPIGPVIVRRDDTGAQNSLVGFEGDGPASFFQTSVIFGKTYTVHWKRGVTPPQLLLSLEFVGRGQWVRLALPYRATNLVIYRNGDEEHPLERAGSLAELSVSQGDRYFADGQFLYVKLIAPGMDEDSVSLDIRRP